MDDALVSVIIPTYNRRRSIGRAIGSALAQTHGEVEVVVVDDGSTDGTQALVRDAYAGDERVRYVVQENAGVAAARNHGLRVARGSYIAFLDSDDAWVPYKLELQIACLRLLPRAGMIWTDMCAVAPDGAVLSTSYLREMYTAYRWFKMDELFDEHHALVRAAPRLAGVVGDRMVWAGDIFSKMVMGNLVHTSTVLLRRERANKVRSFNEDLRYAGEDYDFHLRTCREGAVAYVDVPTISYERGMPDRLTRSAYTIHLASNFLKTIAGVIEGERHRIDLPQTMIDEVMAEAHAWVGQELLERGDATGAMCHFSRSLQHKLTQPRTLGMYGISMLPPAVGQRVRATYREVKALVQEGLARP